MRYKGRKDIRVSTILSLGIVTVVALLFTLLILQAIAKVDFESLARVTYNPTSL